MKVQLKTETEMGAGRITGAWCLEQISAWVFPSSELANINNARESEKKCETEV